MGSGVSGQTQRSQQKLYESQAQQADSYSKLAQESLGEMKTLTQPAISHDTSLLNAANSGDYSQLLQAFAPQQSIINEQMTAAKANIQNTLPAGAGRVAAEAQLPIQAATATASGLNQAYSGALGNLTQIGSAFGGVGLQEAGAGISSGQAAGQTMGTVAQQQAQGKANTMGLIGSLAGGAGAAASGGLSAGGAWGCWIAEAVYGVDDVRTHLVRAWLNGPFVEHYPGRLTMWVYRKIGRQVAWFVRRSSVLRYCFGLLFDRALAKAILTVIHA